jgi:hypothetical protein
MPESSLPSQPAGQSIDEIDNFSQDSFVDALPAYERLTIRLLSLLDGEMILRTRTISDLDADEHRIAIAVCKVIGMTLERWDRLRTQQERAVPRFSVPCLRRACQTSQRGYDRPGRSFRAPPGQPGLPALTGHVVTSSAIKVIAMRDKWYVVRPPLPP